MALPFASASSLLAMSGQWFASSPLPRRQFARILGHKESLKRILGILSIYTFAPRQRATLPHFIVKKREPREEVGVSGPSSTRQQLNKLPRLSPFNLNLFPGVLQRTNAMFSVSCSRQTCLFLDILHFIKVVILWRY